jgi:hypothetical protein
MKKLNKLCYIVIGIILTFIIGIATPTFAATQTSPVITVTKTIAAKTTKNVAVKSVLTAKDSKGYALTFIVSTKATHGSVSMSKATTKGTGAARTYTVTACYTPAKNYVGSDSYIVSVKDGKGNSAVSKVTVTVSEPVTAPAPKATPTPAAIASTATSITTTTSISAPASTPAAISTSDTKDINKLVTTKDAKGWLVDTLTNYTFILDKEAIGTWEQIDFVGTPDEFDGKDVTRKKYVAIRIHNFYDDGREVEYAEKDKFMAELQQQVANPEAIGLDWTKGYINSNSTVSAYEIRKINGKTFMFIQHKSGDYTIRYQEPCYYVCIKTSDMPDPEFAPKPVQKNEAISTTAASFKMKDGTVVNMPGSIKDENAKLTTTIDDKGGKHDKLDYKFTLDKDMVGNWLYYNCYYAGTLVSQFNTNDQVSSRFVGDQMYDIFKDGSMSVSHMDNGKRIYRTDLHWTKGYFMHTVSSSEDLIPAYAITTINGKTFMIMQWKSGDYNKTGTISVYHVYVKTSNTPTSDPNKAASTK